MNQLEQDKCFGDPTKNLWQLVVLVCLKDS